jgi:hypothetical protein
MSWNILKTFYLCVMEYDKNIMFVHMFPCSHICVHVHPLNE